MIEITYTHEKSDFVRNSMKAGEQFSEEEKHPHLIWLPVIFMLILVFEYMSYPLRGDIASFFPDQDPTFPFIFGLIFSVCFLVATLLVYFLRRSGIYMTIILMVTEWLYFGIYGLLKIEHFDFDGNIITYPMLGGGFIPGIDLLMPIYVLIFRQFIILGTLIILWRKFD